MLFGQSVFQSVLTRLRNERGEDKQEEDTTSFRIRGLGLGFVAPVEDNIGTGTEAYFAFLPTLEEFVREPIAEPAPKAPEPAAVMPAHLMRLTEKEIASELAITDKDTETTLAEKRRRFARANHPDGIAPEFRDNANIRMKTANLLIDNAIRNLFWR